MYSGSTLTDISGKLLGAHQKIDRIARSHLDELAPGNSFPSTRTILHFEGNNGPDGVKRKSPAKDEPWHFLQPFDLSDTQLIVLLEDHYKKLIKYLQAGDTVRAAFEAAWLAHGIVDGLTPAHQFPYEEELVALDAGQKKDKRTSLRKKMVLSGQTKTHVVKNNWKMWGPKGIFITHAAFECGVATLVAPLKLATARPSTADLNELQHVTFAEWYRKQAQEIASWGIYDTFSKSGWNLKLARDVRKRLAPTITRAVTTAWYGALCDAA